MNIYDDLHRYQMTNTTFRVFVFITATSLGLAMAFPFWLTYGLYGLTFTALALQVIFLALKKD